ncbi:MAG: hypothetical protein JWN04_6024 [Myxococcaceae bacterium]|nr:hypothetical protein [Myxococcaceae bacterium]
MQIESCPVPSALRSVSYASASGLTNGPAASAVGPVRGLLYSGVPMSSSTVLHTRLARLCLVAAACSGQPAPPAPVPQTGARAAERQAPPLVPTHVVTPSSLAPPAASAHPRADVIFDMSMDPVCSPFESAFEGMSLLLRLLRQKGATISSNVAPLEQVLPGWAGPGRVLVLGMPWKTRYTPAALDAIDSFMRAGGGVLVVVEHDNLYLHAEAQNALTRRYGIEAVFEAARENPRATDPLHGSWPLVAVPEWGIEHARLLLPAPLQVGPPARVLGKLRDPVRADRADAIAEVELGQGRMVVVADAEWIWNMTPEVGLRGDDNEKLALRVFGELLGRAGPLEGVATAPAIPALLREGERCVAFETAGDAFVPEEAPNGFMPLARALHAAGFGIRLGAERSRSGRPCEASILLLPLAPLAEAAPRLQKGRLVLVSDGDTACTAYEGSPWAALPIDYGPSRNGRPLDQLAHAFGLELPRVTMIDADDMTGVSATFVGGRPLVLHRAGIVSWHGKAWEGVLAAAPGTRISDDLFPAESPKHDGEFPRRRIVAGKSEQTWIVARSPTVFAIADLELLTEQGLARSAGKQLLDELIRWLERGAY